MVTKSVKPRRKPATDEQVLSELEPDAVTMSGSWQQRKSAQTRTAILEAAIDCLSETGYSNTTTQLIAKRAQISRGAMLHHYATKQELVESLIDYVIFRRIQLFIEGIATISEEARISRQVGIELYWQTLLTREFAAYLELRLAARTDKELRAILLPRARKYDRIERDTVLGSFPEWAEHPNEYKLAMDYCIASMEGLLLNKDIWNDRTRRQQLRDFISATILLLREGELQMPAPRKYPDK
jgi:AcrR family transcriptional regulator